jgi:predicted nuclease of predicted toxin-antitoxin system
MARFYSDENVPLEVVQVLRSLGHDVLTAFDAGLANRKTQDDEVLHFAMEDKRAVLTLNRLDFHRLHRLTKGAHDGIVTCTRDPDSPALAQRIHQAEKEAGRLAGKLVRVVRGSAGA